MARSSGIVPFAALAFACTEVESLDLPIEDGQSAVLVVRAPAVDGRRPVRLFGIEVGERPPNLSARRGTDLFMLSYDGPLSSRALKSAEINVERTPDSGRPLPEPKAIFSLSAPGTVWAPAEAPPPFLDEVLLPELANCDAEASCSRFFRGRPICELPCPTLSTIDEPPALAPPRLPNLACPSGFAKIDEFCAPSARQSCPFGRAQLLDDTSCRSLVECPSGFREVANPVGTVVYVDASEPPGGNGSSAMPYQTIADALQTAPPVTVLLAAGQYDVGGTITADTVLVGACPEQTSLSNVTVAAGASLTLDGLRVSRVTATGAVSIVNSIVEAGASVAGRMDAARSRFTGAGDISTSASGRPIVSIEDSSVEVEIILAASSSTTIHRSVLQPPTGGVLSAQTSAAATLRDTYVESAGTAFALGQQGKLTFVRTFVDTPVLASLRDEATIEGQIVGLRNARQALVARDQTQVTLSRVYWQTDGAVAVDLEDDAVVDLKGARLRGNGGITFEGEGEVRVEDFESTGFTRLVLLTGRSSLSLVRGRSEGGVMIGPSSPVTDEVVPLVGISSDDCVLGGSPTEASQVAVSIDDVGIDANGGTGVVLCAGTTANVKNLAVIDPIVGVLADCRRACHEPQEIVVLTIDGLTVSGQSQLGLGFLQRGGTFTLRRTRIEGPELYGMYSWGSVGLVEDLVIAGVGAGVPFDPFQLDIYCGENRGGPRLRGPASAIFTEAWSAQYALESSEITLNRFRLDGAGCAGISLGVDGTFTANDGAIDNNHRGLNFLRFAEPTIGTNVTFRGNRQADVYRVADQ